MKIICKKCREHFDNLMQFNHHRCKGEDDNDNPGRRDDDAEKHNEIPAIA